MCVCVAAGVCPLCERSGLKGSLSTYTLTESQSIVEGWDGRSRRSERGKRSETLREKEKEPRLFEVLLKSVKCCDSFSRFEKFQLFTAHRVQYRSHSVFHTYILDKKLFFNAVYL